MAKVITFPSTPKTKSRPSPQEPLAGEYQVVRCVDAENGKGYQWVLFVKRRFFKNAPLHKVFALQHPSSTVQVRPGIVVDLALVKAAVTGGSRIYVFK